MIVKDHNGKPIADKLGNFITKADAKRIKNYMMETSEKPVSIPPKVYHATHPSKIASIMEKGLKPHPIYGEIYFCEMVSHCMQFIGKPAIFIEVDTKRLDRNLFFLSKDHIKIPSRNFEAYTYYKAIPARFLKFSALTEKGIIDIEHDKIQQFILGELQQHESN